MSTGSRNKVVNLLSRQFFVLYPDRRFLDVLKDTRLGRFYNLVKEVFEGLKKGLRLKGETSNNDVFDDYDSEPLPFNKVL